MSKSRSGVISFAEVDNIIVKECTALTAAAEEMQGRLDEQGRKTMSLIMEQYITGCRSLRDALLGRFVEFADANTDIPLPR